MQTDSELQSPGKCTKILLFTEIKVQDLEILNLLRKTCLDKTKTRFSSLLKPSLKVGTLFILNNVFFHSYNLLY